MQLTQDAPDHRFQLRSADGALARVNDRELRRSFLLAPDSLVEDWRPRSIEELEPADMEALLALQPALVLAAYTVAAFWIALALTRKRFAR